MSLSKAWGEDDDASLRALASEGLSAGQIAVKLDRSRNAVCGRAWRLEINLHGSGKKEFRSQKIKPRAKRYKLARAVAVTQPLGSPMLDPPINVEAAGCPTVGLLDLQEGMCKWPVAEFFCGAVALPRRPYCWQHNHASHHTKQPTTVRSRRNWNW
jgi:hypothetical protein